MGRPRKPTAIKILEGNPGKRPLPNEPRFRPMDFQPPSWLDSEGKKVWKFLAPELEKLNLLSQADYMAFVALCQTWAIWISCQRFLKKSGMTFSTPNGYVQQRPEVSISHKVLDQLKSLLTEFGLTPASRSRISLPPAEEGEDPMEALLSGD